MSERVQPRRVPGHEVPVPPERLLHPGGACGGVGLRLPDRRRDVKEPQELPVLRVHHEAAEGGRQPLGHLADGRLRRLAVPARAAGERHRLADEDEGPAGPEASGLVVDEAHRQQRHRDRRGAGGAERQPGGAAPQRHEPGLRLAHPLRKDEDGPARRHRGGRLAEHRLVAGGIAARVLPPLDGQGAGQADEPADQRVAEERGLRERTEPPGHRGEQEHRIDHGVLVVRGEDQRARRGIRSAPAISTWR